MTVSFSCPHCETTLKTQQAVPAGKMIRCPKCSVAFAMPNVEEPAPRPQPKPRPVRPPAREESEPVRHVTAAPQRRPAPPRAVPPPVETLEEIPDADIPEEEESGDRPKRKKKKSKKSRKRSNLPLILGLVVGGVLLFGSLAGAGLWWFWLRSDNPDPLAYVPADSTLLISVDYGALMKHSALAPMLLNSYERSESIFGPWKKETGLEYQDLCDRMVVAINTPVEKAFAPGSKPTITLLIKSRVNLDRGKIYKSTRGATEAKLQGITYYKIGVDEFTSMYMPSRRLIILTNAPEAQLGNLFNADGKKPLLPGDVLDMVGPADENPFWVVVPMGNRTSQAVKDIPIPPNNEEFKPFLDALPQAQSATFTANVQNNQLRLQFALQCGDAGAAQRVADATRDALSKNKNVLDDPQAKMVLAMSPPSLTTFFNEILNSLTVSNEGATSRLTADTRMETLQAVVHDVIMLRQNPRGAMPAGAPPMGGMPRRGGPPGGGP
jgi:hypothetical protein